MADASRLPFRDHSFEVVVSFETIEHFSTPQDFLSECSRLLETGGELIISTPNRQMSIFQDNPYHFREYRPQEFINLLQNFFSHIQLYGQMYRSYPIRWIRRSVARMLSFTQIGKGLVASIQRYIFGDRPMQPRDIATVDETYKVLPAESLSRKLVQPHYLVCIAKKLKPEQIL
jgi:SAM-dependent methyltransferase